MKTNFTILIFLFAIASYGQQGLCVDPDQIDEGAICLEIYDPVCGCDDVTYQNDCYALNYGGVTSWTDGECSTGVDPCTDLSNVGFGLCDLALGIAIVNGECVSVSGCSYSVDGIDYSAAFYADIEECEACLDDGCIDPDLIDPDMVCFDIYDPVCGCDNVTYSNECYAQYYNGVTSWTEGECTSGVEPCTDVLEVDFGDCDMAMGIAVVDGECIGISGCGYTVDGVDYSAAFYTDIEECEACLDDGCIDPDLIDPDMACFDIYDPVCGCDNVTYSNECYAHYYNGVTSWTEGECANDDCLELPTGLDFGMCAAVVGTALVDGTCVGISGCGTVASDNVDYAEYFYDNYEDCVACAEAEDCINQAQIDSSMICITLLDPVCGCDDITYENDCYAYYYGGVTSWAAGACNNLDECPELDPELDFGDCDAIIGVALVNGSCTAISGCSSVASNGVDYAAYFYDSEEDCLSCADSTGCFNPDQIDPEFPCTEEYDPVCGCDGVTYSNDCYAFYYSGVTSWTEGACSPPELCDDVSDVDFGPCDMYLGVAIVDGVCTDVSGCGYIVDNVDYSGAFFDSMTACEDTCLGTGCINPDQIDPEFPCTEEYDPVCGCDSVTYSNDCYAYYYGGVTSWTPGECTFTGIEDLEQLVDVKFIQGRFIWLKTNELIESVALYDLAGKTIWQEGQLAPGEHQMLLPIDQTGIYLYRIQLNDQVQTGKVLMH